MPPAVNMLLLFPWERMAAHPVFQSLRLTMIRNIDASFDEASERDIAKIIGSDAPDDCHLPSKPRKLYGGVCC